MREPLWCSFCSSSCCSTWREERAAGLGWLRPAAYLTGLVAAAGIAFTAFSSPQLLPSFEIIAAALGGGGAGPIGDALFTQFVLAFQLVGVLLLTSIVGAVSLVQRRAVSSRAAEAPAEGAEGTHQCVRPTR